jgi:hypothetical protein
MSDPAILIPAAPAANALDEQGVPCPGCRRMLPIRARRHGEVAAHWECTACHAPFTGILLKDASLRMPESVRIGQVHFDTSSVAPLPVSLRQLVREFVASRRKSLRQNDDRRAVPRVPTQLDVTVLPLDESWTPRSKPLPGMVVDLSSHGLGMVTAQAIEAPHIVVQIRHPAGHVQVLGDVVWTKDIGHGIHGAGVQFLMRFGRNTIVTETD